MIRLAALALLVPAVAAADSSELEAQLGAGIARGDTPTWATGPMVALSVGLWHGPIAFALRGIAFTGIGASSQSNANLLTAAVDVQYAPARWLWFAGGPGLDAADGGAIAGDVRAGVVVYDRGGHQLAVSLEAVHAERGTSEAQNAHSIWTFGLLFGYEDRP
ncbi:MAG TPA: hypothetical protein VLT45_01505 [Kofleriaceae bacterium]|nr:hypothetical protein [Kofleriaceae bacterium]